MAWQAILAQSPGAQPEQQDCGAAWPSADGRRLLVVLADGAGGHRGGEQAAKAAVQAAETLWASDAPAMENAGPFLEKISRAAHDAVIALPHSPRATWLALFADADQAAWVHSGDSRLYHFGAGGLQSRTLDHSLVQVLVEKGKVDAADATAHADRSVLLQSLGGDRYLPAEQGAAPVKKGDAFVLCTDGVWAAVEESDLARLATVAITDLRRAADDVVAKAVRAGGDKADNASLWILRQDL